jgi:hypothetical protein
MWIALVLAACRRDPDPTPLGPTAPDEPVPFAPAPATLTRITDAEWRNSAEDLFGVRFAGDLPVDFRLLAYARVGGSQLTVPPADLDQYEAAAWEVARAVAPDDAAARDWSGGDGDLVAVRSHLLPLLTRAWRRPPTSVELDALVDRYAGLQLGFGDAVALQATVAATLLSPDFLFRVETGTPVVDRPGWRTLTGWERAGRLASFLLASVPDEALVEAASAGRLDDVDGLEAEAVRLLGTRRARAAMAAFFAETVDLHELESVTKDEALYPEFTAALRAEMAAEVEDLFLGVALDRGEDLRELLVTDRTTAGPNLADLYGISSAATALPPEQDRGGLLGRAAILAVQSHNTLTSPTNRGKFVRTRLLCQEIAPPPPGVSTELELAEGATLRDRLEQHAVDPACSPCHKLMDPIGFGLEHFDPVGRRRQLENGEPIDSTGEIAGVGFDGGAELGRVVAENEDFGRCLATSLYRYANAAVERPEDDVVIDAIDLDFTDAGRTFEPLVRAIVRSDGFLMVGAAEGVDCDVDGQIRTCRSACGEGSETCTGGTWKGCTAPAPAPETCDGADEDCDGDVDQGLERTCDAEFGPGVQTCADGRWAACEGPAAPGEVCNAADDDGDGDVDEGLAARLEVFTAATLASEGHYACDVGVDAWSPACHAAVHRGCGARGCAVTGFGPVVHDGADWSVTCLDDTRATVVGTTFTELSTHHYGCDGAYRLGGACSAAISRLCASRGLGTGYGPVENSGDDAAVVCVPGATVLESSYSALSAEDAGCNQGTRWGAACDRAIHAWCVDQGWGSGFGPLENSGDLAIVACVEVP